jgi:hypothetical protein
MLGLAGGPEIFRQDYDAVDLTFVLLELIFWLKFLAKLVSD